MNLHPLQIPRLFLAEYRQMFVLALVGLLSVWTINAFPLGCVDNFFNINRDV